MVLRLRQCDREGRRKQGMLLDGEKEMMQEVSQGNGGKKTGYGVVVLSPGLQTSCLVRFLYGHARPDYYNFSTSRSLLTIVDVAMYDGRGPAT